MSTHTIRIILVTLVVMLVMPGAPAIAVQGSDVIGKVTIILKTAYAIQDALPRKLERDSDIRLGDVISTGKGARLEIILNDGSVVTLGERTHFVVQEFIMSDTRNNAVLRLLEGAFKVTSGKLTKLANASMQVQTNTATIGIRGTTFWGGMLDGKFEVALLGGKGVYVETRGGRVELTRVGQGIAVESADKAPTNPVIWAEQKTLRAIATVAFP